MQRRSFNNSASRKLTIWQTGAKNGRQESPSTASPSNSRGSISGRVSRLPKTPTALTVIPCATSTGSVKSAASAAVSALEVRLEIHIGRRFFRCLARDAAHCTPKTAQNES